jgi:hypothetical protein
MRENPITAMKASLALFRKGGELVLHLDIFMVSPPYFGPSDSTC